MISENENIKTSKFLSLVLRHKPETIGLELDANGWADVNSLIEKANKSNVRLSIELLRQIVETNSKQRFTFNEQQDKIRANQGHSIDIELGLKAVVPPVLLFHGTAERFVASILDKGLMKQQRQHVHLSADIQTARMVGQRHGKPFIFEVLAGVMHSDNYQFFLSDNGVWLTDTVPVKYLRSPDDEQGFMETGATI